MLGLVLVVTAIVFVASVYPVLDDLWVDNPNWNGLSEFYRSVKPIRVKSGGDLLGFDPLNSTLFIVGPSRGFSEENVQGVKSYLLDGGRVVLLDDFGSANELLAGLGLGTRFNGSLLRDVVFFDPVPEFPRLLNFTLYGVGEVVFDYGTVLDLGERAQVLVRSSPLSYLQNGEVINSGEFPVVARISYGDGVLVLVSDSSVWLNSMIDRADNRELLNHIYRGSVLIDVGHSYPTQLLAFKWWLQDVYAFVDVAEIRYGLALLMVIVVFRVKLRDEAEVEVDEVEELLNEYPEWSKEQLLWLVEQQRKR